MFLAGNAAFGRKEPLDSDLRGGQGGVGPVSVAAVDLVKKDFKIR